MLPNFGSRTGVMGRVFNYSGDAYDALKSPLGKNLKGIGAIPEGIE